jgi:hypothetical protein
VEAPARRGGGCGRESDGCDAARSGEREGRSMRAAVRGLASASVLVPGHYASEPVLRVRGSEVTRSGAGPGRLLHGQVPGAPRPARAARA